VELPTDAVTVVRILCGAFLLPHTVAKLSNIERASQFFDKLGLRPARFFVVFTAVMEVIAAFGLISGYYPRVGAFIAAAILVVAAWAIAKLHGLKWRWQHPGIEYMLFWAAVCLSVGWLA
jgi:putative oxidoreductase